MDVIEEDESAYHFYISNCQKRPGSQIINTSAHFTTQRRTPIFFNNADNWEVGLYEIFLPGIVFNIYPPFNKNVFEIRKVKKEHFLGKFHGFKMDDFYKSESVVTVNLPPGAYTPESFCIEVNRIVDKPKIFHKGLEDIEANINAHRKEQKEEQKKAEIKIEKKEEENIQLNIRNKGVFSLPPEVGCPTTFDPKAIWDTKLCGPIPSWWVNEKKLYDLNTVSEVVWEPMELPTEEEEEEEKEEAGMVPQKNFPGGGLRKNVDNRKLIRYKEHTRRLKITLPPGYFLVCPHRRIQKLLGWSSFTETNATKITDASGINQIYGHSETEKYPAVVYGNAFRYNFRSFIFPETCDFNRHNRTVFLSSNLVKESVAGTTNLPLMKIIDISTEDNRFHQIFQIPQYLPLRQETFTDIEFQMTNDLGENFPFQRGETSKVIVHFRKKNTINEENV